MTAIQSSRKSSGKEATKGSKITSKADRHPPRKDHKKDHEHDSTATISTTRLCIKNIPPSFSSLQLRDFLKQEYQRRNSDQEELVITDCRVLMNKGQSRRIAFAGFASPSMALNVKQSFHQTFARTAKLSVEFARTIQPKKEDIIKEEKKAPKKEEPKKKKATSTAKAMLENTVGSNKAKFWSNDLNLEISNNGEEATTKDTQQQTPPDIATKEEEDDDSSSDGSSTASSSDEDEADPLDKFTDAKNKLNVMSDLDFLKSKQKMVDNLEELEEGKDSEDDPSPPTNEKKETTAQKEVEDKDDDASTSSSDSDSSSSTSEASVPDPQPTTDDHDKQQTETQPSTIKDDEDDEDTTPENQDTTSMASDRLFVRNLPYTTTEEELEEQFAAYGQVMECHIPVDDRKMAKGFAFVTMDKSQNAVQAMTELDGTDFQGRFLHVLPARRKPEDTSNPRTDTENHDRALSYKERQELARRQKEIGNNAPAQGWSASFVRGDAVVDSLADRLGLKKGEILNVKEGLSSGDAAVRLALGETQVIEENRSYFKDHGIDMEALVSAKSASGQTPKEKRSTTSLLVKNLPYDTQVEELHKVFGIGEPPKRILLPPSRTIALVEYGHSSDAKRAFRKLAYRRFKSVPLYLEWAPMEAIESSDAAAVSGEAPQPTIKEEESTTTAHEEQLEGPTPSVYVKNLNFSTTEEKLRQYFNKAVGDVRAVRIPTKMAPTKRQGKSTDEVEMQSLSMGFGFVEFASHESARKALAKLQGSLVDGHALELKPSTKSLTQQPAVKLPKKKNPTKITVRNVPFQASRTEILKLFGSFGQLKRVRLPKKFNGGHRGFAFVEFVTHKEALTAMKSLSSTHLYGRHLVLEWAQDEDSDTVGNAESLNVLRQKAQRDVQGGGTNKRQKLS